MREFELSYPNGLRIHRGLTEAALEKFRERVDVAVHNVGTGWIWYRLPTFFDGELGIGIELGFNRGKLERIAVFHDDPTIYGRDWSDWSKEKEQLRAKATKSWFKAKGFKTGRHSWGEIWSNYDERSGFGSGGVRYAP